MNIKDFALKASIVVWNIIAIPFVILVVVLHLIHPVFHGLEGGAFDVVMPTLDVMAASAGGGKLIEWVHQRRSGNHPR